MSRHNLTSSDGFSLIELMIVVAIIGILAAVAVPSYLNHVLRTRQADGITRLLDIKAAQEKFYALENTYYIPPGGVLAAATANFSGLVSFDVTDVEFFNYNIAAGPGGVNVDFVISSQNDLNTDGNATDCWSITSVQNEPVQVIAGACAADGENLKFSTIIF